MDRACPSQGLVVGSIPTGGATPICNYQREAMVYECYLTNDLVVSKQNYAVPHSRQPTRRRRNFFGQIHIANVCTCLWYNITVNQSCTRLVDPLGDHLDVVDNERQQPGISADTHLSKEISPEETRFDFSSPKSKNQTRPKAALTSSAWNKR